MKFTKSILLASLLFVISFTGCTYNESPVYSTTYSDTYSITIYRHQWDFEEIGHWFIRYNIPNLTPSVIDNGAVLVYYKNSVNNWVLLPYSKQYNQYGYQFIEEIWFGYAVGTLDIDYRYTNPFDMTPPQVLELKIILVRL